MSELEPEFLEYLEWCVKINEKLTLILLKIKDHTDITESDYEILQLWHRSWYLGLHPLRKTQMKGKDETAVQGGLFGDKEAGSSDGTDIVNQLSKN